jgi:hypothetical protein
MRFSCVDDQFDYNQFDDDLIDVPGSRKVQASLNFDKPRLALFCPLRGISVAGKAGADWDMISPYLLPFRRIKEANMELSRLN